MQPSQLITVVYKEKISEDIIFGFRILDLFTFHDMLLMLIIYMLISVVIVLDKHNKVVIYVVRLYIISS